MATKNSRALTGSRQLHEQVPPLSATFDPLTGRWTAVPQVGFTKTLAPTWLETGGAISALFYEGSFNLAGNVIDDLTLGPLAISLQDPGVYQLTSSASARLRVIDIITDERLNVTNVVDEIVLLNSCPSMNASVHDWTQLQFGRHRLMISNNSFATPDLLQTLRDDQFGSFEPTAAHKLWHYRIAVPTGTFEDGNILNVPASRYVIQAVIFAEDDLAYIMRLKRSNELAQV